MANQEHVALLKQGIDSWNKWRRENAEIQVDLSSTDLSNLDLSMGNFSPAHVSAPPIDDIPITSYVRLQLPQVDFSLANLQNADFNHANLTGAKLRGAHLSSTNFSHTNLSDADLSYANIHYTNFSSANMASANFTGAEIDWASFSHTDLSQSDMSQTTMGWNIFATVDLGTVKGLDTVRHEAPSSVDIYTLLLSQREMPEIFLRGAGVPQNLIEYAHSLNDNSIQYYTCFISYSSKNQDFAERLYADFRNKRVSCWLALHNMRTGDKIRECIDGNIRLYDKVLLILSEYAIASPWVETEVETALEKERQMQERGNPQTVLFTIRLDDTILHTTKSWAKEVRRRHIADFTGWKQDNDYQKALQRLIHDLKASAASNIGEGN